MERITQAASPGLAEYRRDHPELDIGPVAGHWYAWKQAEDKYSGELTHGGTADELLAKLDGG